MYNISQQYNQILIHWDMKSCTWLKLGNGGINLVHFDEDTFKYP